MSDLLVVEGLVAGYDDSVVLEDISLSIDTGESLAVLGRNGVGKTTLLVTLMGFTRLHSGSITWAGKDISHVPTFQRVHAGLGWVPQERMMFPSLTVDEHLTAVARPGDWDRDRIYRLLPRLEERRSNLADRLSGGEQQMLAIARALMVNPRLLLLDEPLEGLAPIVVQELTRVLEDLVSSGALAVVIVEQHAKIALSLAKRAVVLDRGRIVHRSDSGSLLADADMLQQLVTVA